MAARIKLTDGLTAGQNSASIQIRLDDPPYLFVAPGTNPDGTTFTGSIAIQQSMETVPAPNNGGGVSNSGVTDANVNDWISIIPTINAGDQIEWRNPLYRIRVNGANIATGTAKVYMLAGIRSLKTQRPRVNRKPGKEYASRNG